MDGLKLLHNRFKGIYDDTSTSPYEQYEQKSKLKKSRTSYHNKRLTQNHRDLEIYAILAELFSALNTNTNIFIPHVHMIGDAAVSICHVRPAFASFFQNMADDRPIQGFFLRGRETALVLKTLATEHEMKLSQIQTTLLKNTCPILLQLLHDAKFNDVKTSFRKLFHEIADRLEELTDMTGSPVTPPCVTVTEQSGIS
jgi:hypothetical protein